MDKQSGFLIMVVVVLLVVISGLATAFVAMTVSSSNTSINAISANNAYDLAASGIENGSYQLALGTCNSAWSSAVTVTGTGQYQYNCTNYSASTTITSALTTSSTTISLASVSGFASFGSITVDSEIIYYDGISGSTLQNAQRGQNGTTSATHSLGAGARQSQYIIVSQGGAPSLSAATGNVTLSQAAFLIPGVTYYAAGRNGSIGVILRFNGTSWSTVLTGPAGFTFYGLNVNSTYGQAVGYTTANVGSIYQFNGSAWSLLTGSVANSRFDNVSCDAAIAPTDCWVAGQSTSPPRALLYHAGVPYLTAINNFMVSGVSCTGGRCVAVGDNHTFFFPSNSGSPFTTNPVDLSSTLSDVDCPQASQCVAVRNNAVYYYNGSFWNGAFNISGPNLSATQCPSNGNCIVVGRNGRVFNCALPITSSASCSIQTTPGSLDLADVYCLSTSNCLAVGSGTIAYYYTGGSWNAITLPANYILNTVGGISGGQAIVTPTVFHNQ